MATTSTGADSGRVAGGRLAGRLPGMLSGRDPGTVDGALAAAVGGFAALLHLTAGGPGEGLFRLPSWVGLVLLVVMSTSLAWRRVDPGRVLAVSGACITVYYVGGLQGPAALIVFNFALYAIAAFGEDRREGVWSLGASLFFMTLSFVATAGPASVVTADWGLSAFVFVTSWAVGDAARTRTRLADELRDRAAQVEALRRAERDELVAGERRRIARELHDVVSHTVSVVVVQAAGARRIAARDPAAAERALAAIESTGRDAMAELRRMLGVLRDGDLDDPTAPAPDLAAVGPLVEQLRAAGLPVELDADLDRPLPAGVALTVHRVVQEGLTNVLRHARDVGEVRVTVERGAGQVVVSVVDDGRPAGDTAGTGAGLVGLRERVALHGGEVTAEHGVGRGFVLRARVPLGERS